MLMNRIDFYLWYWRTIAVDKLKQFNDHLNSTKQRNPIKWHLAFFGGFLLNILLVIMIMIVIVAQPAMREFNENILHKQQISVTFYDRNGDLIGRRGIRLDDSMKLDEYPKYFLDAVLATEDRRFYSHFGIDVVGTFRAIANNQKSEKIQGGSSITQQLAKNLFLSNERTMERKIKEAFLALALEWNLSKDEILKLYLERAYMGGGSYGAAEATRYYFNKSAKDLSVSEAAVLAGLFKAPSKFSPENNPDESKKRWLTVLDNLRVTRSITDEQFEEALIYPPQLNVLKDSTAANYYLDWAWEEIRELENRGLLGDSKVFKVTTMLDLKVQRHAESVMDKQLEEADDKYGTEQVAMVIMDTSGGVISMIGGNDYRESSFNRATKALRQPGSSFKPYVYAAAVEAGILDKDTIVTDRPTCIGKWCPHNYNGSYSGSMPAWQAMAQSINSIPVQLSIQLGKESSSVKVGRKRIIDMAYKMGVRSELYDAQSLPIGSVELTPLDQAVGYTSLANGGYKVKPYAIKEIKNSQGETVYITEPQREQVLNERVVSNMNFMLNKVIEQGTGTGAKIQGQTIAGKTGTTNAYKDAWFVGYTGSLVGSIWMGNDDNTSSERMTGGSLPARTWKLVMEEALKTQPVKPPPFLTLATQPVTNNKAKKTTTTPEGPKQFEPPVEKERSFWQKLFNFGD